MTSQQPVFPCPIAPSSPAECRLLGLYPQRQEGLWMQRVKILGGILPHHQWAALADMCRRYTPSAPLLLTTRQDIEFHNVTAEIIPRLQADLARAGLTGVGACGDTLRNITLCPGNGLCKDTPDLVPAARALCSLLEGYAGIYSLPRKFKISLSACARACAQPWINDLGFIMHHENNGLNITAIGAGSLGPRPATGMLLHENLPAEDMGPLAMAAIRLFDAHGDRNNRGRARLRHVRERFGDERFRDMLDVELGAVRRDSVPALPPVSVPETPLHHACDLNLLYGGLSPDQAEAIAALMQSMHVAVRPQTHHRISVFARDANAVRASIDINPYLRQLVNGPDIVSCPGMTYCSHGLVHTHAVEKALRGHIPDSARHPIRISGCPNGCAQSAVAGIGLIGKIRKDHEGSRVEGFRVVTGGAMGTTPALASEQSDFVPAGEIPDFIKNILR
jgi:sulfite reductase (ferredoxin)